jgi:hypothetical protein
MRKGFVVQPFEKFWNLLCAFEYVMLFDAWSMICYWLTLSVRHYGMLQFSFGLTFWGVFTRCYCKNLSLVFWETLWSLVDVCKGWQGLGFRFLKNLRTDSDIITVVLKNSENWSKQPYLSFLFFAECFMKSVGDLGKPYERESERCSWIQNL